MEEINKQNCNFLDCENVALYSISFEYGMRGGRDKAVYCDEHIGQQHKTYQDRMGVMARLHSLPVHIALMESDRMRKIAGARET